MNDKYIELSNLYLNGSLEEKNDIINTWSLKDSERLRIVNKQLAELSVIENDEKYLKIGLTLQLIENLQLDFRENLMALSLLYRSGQILGIDIDCLFKEFAEKGSPKIKEFILEFLSRNDEDKSIKSMGFKSIHHPVFRYQFKYGDYYD